MYDGANIVTETIQDKLFNTQKLLVQYPVVCLGGHVDELTCQLLRDAIKAKRLPVKTLALTILTFII